MNPDIVERNFDKVNADKQVVSTLLKSLKLGNRLEPVEQELFGRTFCDEQLCTRAMRVLFSKMHGGSKFPSWLLNRMYAVPETLIVDWDKPSIHNDVVVPIMNMVSEHNDRGMNNIYARIEAHRKICHIWLLCSDTVFSTLISVFTKPYTVYPGYVIEGVPCVLVRQFLSEFIEEVTP